MVSIINTRDDIIKFSKDRLLENHPRDDYRKLLELKVYLDLYFWMENFQILFVLKHQVPIIMLGGWPKLFIG